ncbi:cellulose synthase/poly-beta-1,6-N-acetylglucosamine synthase-like glycosyltransferase [Thermosporothrix hazakensis]|jgi:cellulose synthase/poly-beta-1,6-N-acetylglucosamine synthase-like glycosyltransferase|uniref:Cellulose synthase/poly-beta-1,6-N-acetylglucosamine synthase-like glycosyltransferase n=2 Tax=Thermosporothrix TaxID=768650 RepID=A0A326UG23_THEHA|nr:glycosyltransferase family 2 protein [Thermosporothrix hazakensis]PZW35960.1 cellulose synthase/poly-beta-1,6-N-acetylglucosamine synthase-like glycosyltransferase [Thermosporothrix hazakensis]BBH88429.1 glycosyl transferase [Thermosporothrix sp. COM3]GCE46615.1 glycosyl transferase [Thermosporothrix hazakensis]
MPVFSMMLEALRWLLLLMTLCLALPLLYLCLLSCLAIIVSRKRRTLNIAHADDVTFALLIPAHNEESVIKKLLESLAALDYPKDRYTIHVVADNCTDHTAEIARPYARVHERTDTTRRGKGYALNWLLKRIEGEIYDAYVILDADSVVTPSFLRAFAYELRNGALALQGQNTVLNPTDSPSTALRLIALTLMNHVRPLGRNGLGASSTLTGNGMCLARATLQRHPWQAFSLAEDYQYYLTLITNGIRVRYVPEALVRSEMPTTFQQMRTQDIRWEAAEEQRSTWQTVCSLLKAGIQHHDLARLEAIAELLTPPLSVIVSGCLLTLLASLVLFSPVSLAINALLLLALCFYAGTALYLLRPPRAVYLALLHAPRFILWKLWVILALRRNKKHTGEWVRTSRISS